ncbi:TRM11 family SAM-dependent methyltransferase [Hyperthermus butylicus]|uniref:DNA modification methylase n=1 Tax=Hyperthermus butylicus (strain DSM 5456 / JCM 9403 / PLM1-5) TaxID=415426 RepID=A2BJP1_HYPBU|nr:TRM11 family methyltransferase [Hyperthermus butylicus]ABM80202.1 putative DNA modification methylase [Hyperthermus butylicus DSM 5456]
MKLYYALLSGLHASLPLAELRGILEAEGYRYRIVEVFDQLAVFTCNCSSVERVPWRAGLIHEAGLVLAASEPKVDDIVDSLLATDLCSSLEPGDRVRVEFTRVRGYAKKALPDNTARLIAEKITAAVRSCGVAMDPRNPTKTLHIIATQGAAVAGLRQAVQDRKLLDSHRPQKRPFFHPGSLDPRLARLFLNLSRAAPPGPYLDPFCGTGGFPLEAQTLGIPAICGELADKLANGAKTNLQAYPGSQYIITIAQWDATQLPLRDNSIQSIGTDPPYGRSVSTRGKKLETLLEQFLHEAARVLKPGAYLAYAAPHWAEQKALQYTEQAGLKPLEHHYMRVHGSLTRIIILARKEH